MLSYKMLAVHLNVAESWTIVLMAAAVVAVVVVVVVAEAGSVAQSYFANKAMKEWKWKKKKKKKAK